jgi:glyoxylase-like metal-dependent hydrolase (beta-lactamase superfamily II)
VDPGWEVERILSELSGLKVVKIVATHAHFDHVGAVEDLRERTGAEFVMHRADLKLLDVVEEMASHFGLKVRKPRPDGFVEDGDVLRFGSSASGSSTRPAIRLEAYACTKVWCSCPVTRSSTAPSAGQTS